MDGDGWTLVRLAARSAVDPYNNSNFSLSAALPVETLAGLLPPAQWQRMAAVVDEEGRTLAHLAAANTDDPDA